MTAVYRCPECDDTYSYTELEQEPRRFLRPPTLVCPDCGNRWLFHEHDHEQEL